MKRLLRLVISLIVRTGDIIRDGLRTLSGRPCPGRCVVIYYHAVPKHHRSLFARQLDCIRESARVLPIDQSGPVPPGEKAVVITFDDAFISVAKNARPELASRNLPWTVFVPAGCLGQPPSWIENARPESRGDRVMTAQELRELLRDPRVTIASHSVHHANLLRIDEAESRRELADSKSILESALNTKVDLFSFPYGAHKSRHHGQARETGYRRVFTSEPSLAFREPDEFVTGRVGVDPDDWPLEFRLKIAGAYRWAGYLQARKRSRRTHPENE